MEQNHFKRLPPNTDLNEVSENIRKCVIILRKNKISLSKLIEMVHDASGGKVNLNENTLKAFVSPTRADAARTNKSATLEALYNFFFENAHNFENPIRAEISGLWESFVPDLHTNGDSKIKFTNTMEHVFGGLLLNWVGGSPDQIRKYKNELCDEYYLFRRSVREHRAVVRSEVKVEWISVKDLSVTHWHHDRNDETRTSRGFMIPTEYNHIAILNVEDGIAIEFLALKKPTTAKFKRLIGFIVTINSNGVLVSARVSLVKRSAVSSQPPIRFAIDIYDGNPVMKKTLEYLEDDRAMTIPDRTKVLYEEIGISGDKDR